MHLSESTGAATMLLLVATITSASPFLGKQLLLAPISISRDNINYRLPASAKPIHYKISLIPFLEDERPETFNGSVQIRVQALEDTKSITLHYADMIIHSLKVTKMWTQERVHVTQSYQNETNFFVITHNASVDGGKFKAYEDYLLQINYTGYHRDDMAGFYRSSYTNENGSTVWLVTTQFEPTSARRAFPCFDEPVFKAKFEIEIKKKGDMRAISNMPSRTDVANRDWEVFEETPLMSTYLVAFVVSDFTYIGDETQHFKVWSRKNTSEDAKFGADIGIPILESLEEFLLGFRYELPKLDVVAVPDFSAGAMENWGLTTYRESRILHGKATSSSEQATATILAHEFSHQWFGDVVSPEWWNYLWLNEGFATYFEYFAVDKVEPSWQMKEQFVLYNVQAAMKADALLSTHPITHAVDSPYNAVLNFDIIAYQKAGSVIRMLEHVLTTDVFRAGLKRYLEINAHSFVNEAHLYNALDIAFKEMNPEAYVDIDEMMRTWTHQAGFPLLTVTSNGDSKLTLKQNRFLSSSASPTEAKVGVWHIPITYTIQGGNFNDTSTKLWMRDSSLELNWTTEPNTTKWHIFNVQEVGYYRVNYDDRNWNLLSQHLRSRNYTSIHVVNRAQLVDDALTLAQAGLLRYHTALDLVQYLEHEEDMIPRAAAHARLAYVSVRMSSSPHYKLFQEYLLNTTLKMYEKLGFEDKDTDDHVTKLHRNLVVSWMCGLEYEPCIRTAKEKYQDLKSGKVLSSDISPDLLNVIYTNAIVQGNESEWHYLWEKYIHSNSALEQEVLMDVLACTPNQTIVYKYLETAMKDHGPIRMQDFESVFISVISCDSNFTTPFSFLKNNYEHIATVHSDKIRAIFSTLAQRINTAEDLKMFQEFINERMTDKMKHVIKQALETAEENIKWSERHKSEVEAWLLKEPSGAMCIMGTNSIIFLSLLFVTHAWYFPKLE